MVNRFTITRFVLIFVCLQVVVAQFDEVTWLGRIRALKAVSPLVKKAAIIGVPEGSLVVDAGGFGGTKEELKALATSLGHVSQKAASGDSAMGLDGLQFTIQLPTTASGVSDKGDAIYLARAEKAIVVTICEGGETPDEVKLAVEALAAELDKQNFWRA
ncbi:unnamed protein product, partial [Mesorhabditis spiculigera]